MKNEEACHQVNNSQTETIDSSGNQSQMKDLIEINNILLQLISIAKLQIILSKQIKDIETEASKDDNNKMKVDSYGI